MTVVNVTSNTTWTCPTGVLYIDLYMKGGGAAGNPGGNYIGGYGGGEGGVVNEALYAVTPGVTYQCTFGTGGAGTAFASYAGNPSIFKDQNGNPLKTAAGGLLSQVSTANTQGATGQGTHGGAGGAGDYPTGHDGSVGTLGCGGGGGGASTGSAGHGGSGGDGIYTITYHLSTASFSGTPTSGSNPLTVTWTNSTTEDGTTTYGWTMGDGHTDNVKTPSPYQYTTAGTYDVILTASTAYGYTTQTRTGYITVFTHPICFSFIICADNMRGL